MYSWIVSWWNRRRLSAIQHESARIQVPTHLLLSATAAMLNTCLTLPLDVLSSRYQLSSGTKETAKEEYNKEVESHPLQGILAKMKSIIVVCKEYKSLWKGLTPSLLLCCNPAIHYTVFDAIKVYLLDSRDPLCSSNASLLNSKEAFVLGLIAKFVATIATYPLIRAKLVLMVTSTPPTMSTPSSRIRSTTLSPFTELYHCLVDEYSGNGLEGLYQGFRTQLFHTLLKSALLMMVRERITQTAHRMLATATVD
jgi:hypothetical protein